MLETTRRRFPTLATTTKRSNVVNPSTTGIAKMPKNWLGSLISTLRSSMVRLARIVRIGREANNGPYYTRLVFSSSFILTGFLPQYSKHIYCCKKTVSKHGVTETGACGCRPRTSPPVCLWLSFWLQSDTFFTSQRTSPLILSLVGS